MFIFSLLLDASLPGAVPPLSASDSTLNPGSPATAVASFTTQVLAYDSREEINESNQAVLRITFGPITRFEKIQFSARKQDRLTVVMIIAL
jgi:hypothetical protein